MTLDCEPDVETVIDIYAVNEETGEREPDVLAVLSWQRSTEAEGADCSQTVCNRAQRARERNGCFNGQQCWQRSGASLS
jgi:hypothetical protein